MPVYFIRSGNAGPVKIGKAADVLARRRELQTAHYTTLKVVREIPGAMAEERQLHRHYANLRLRGEWFAWCETMMFIETSDLPRVPSKAKSKLVRFGEDATTVSDVIALWPSPTDFAVDVNAPIDLVRVWKHRGFIPADRWAAIESAAVRKGIHGASASDLARVAAKQRGAEPRP